MASSSRGPFHAGERAVQRRAGVEGMATRVGHSIHAAVPPAAAAFLAERSWVVIATTDAAGRPWASILSGAPGFARVVDAGGDAPSDGARTVRLAAAPAPGDPLAEHASAGGFVGLVALDPATRRRMRVNGRLTVDGADGALVIHADQVYANCPKYIQRRLPAAPADAEEPGAPPVVAWRGTALTEAQRAWLRRADTFFVATNNPGEGADASHRGGMPGFVRVEATAGGGDRLTWPDYAGNAMFNTLGNIAAHPWAGIVVPDFATGATLQLTGRAAVDWDPARAAAHPGAERLVTLDVEAVVEIRGALPFRLGGPEYSPFNPAPPGPDAGPA